MIDYQPCGQGRGRTRQWLLLAVATILAVAVFVVREPLLHWMQWVRYGPRRSWIYPSRVGVDAAMLDIAAAVQAYADVNGVLPNDLKQVKPYLVCKRSAGEKVSGFSLLPFVVMLPSSDPEAAPLTRGGRFVLVVYLKRAGPMRWDAATLVDEHGVWDIFDDEHLARYFGPARVQQFHQSAYQLP